MPMKNPHLEQLKNHIVRNLTDKFGYCGVAESDHRVLINSGDEDDLRIMLENHTQTEVLDREREEKTPPPPEPPPPEPPEPVPLTPMHNHRKWEVAEYKGEQGRIIVDGYGTLIADFYAECPEDYGIPDNYRWNARRAAMCVNACNGIDPADIAKLIKTATRVIEESESRWPDVADRPFEYDDMAHVLGQMSNHAPL